MDHVWTTIVNTNVCLSKQISESVLRKVRKGPAAAAELDLETVLVPVW